MFLVLEELGLPALHHAAEASVFDRFGVRVTCTYAMVWVAVEPCVAFPLMSKV